MKLLLLFLLTIASGINNHNKVIVIERQTSLNIVPGYTVSDGDSVFYFKRKKYVLLTRECFGEDGNIKKAFLRKELGFLEFTRQDIISDKKSDFSQSIKASIIDSKHIKVNSDIFLISKIDKKSKRLYYIMKSQPQYLNCLIYQ